MAGSSSAFPAVLLWLRGLHGGLRERPTGSAISRCLTCARSRSIRLVVEGARLVLNGGQHRCATVEKALHDFGVYDGLQALSRMPPSPERPVTLSTGLDGARKTTARAAKEMGISGTTQFAAFGECP